MTDIRTDNEAFNKWLSGYGKVNWRMGGLSFLFTYNNVMCAGLISKTYIGGKSIFDVTIRPLQAKQDIGNGAGEAVYKTFK